MKSIKTSSLLIGILGGAAAACASTDYGPAVWTPPCNANYYTSGYGHKFCVIHDMDGFYGPSISMMAGCGWTASSVHYLVNSGSGTSGYASELGRTVTDVDGKPAGQVTQMIREGNYSWHACCWNSHSFGTEHEGFASNPAWYTDAQYQSSANLQRHLCNAWGIAKDRNHIVAHGQKSNSAWCTWAEGNLGIDAHCNTHTDPGPYWDWNKFMGYINQPTVNYAMVPYGPIGMTSDGRQEIFVVGRGASHHVWHQWQTSANGGWSGAADMGGTVTFQKGVKVERNMNNLLEVFAIATDGQTYHNWQTSGTSWSGWYSFGGWVSKICVAANPSDRRLELFGIGSDGLVYHNYQNSSGGWSGWGGMGSPVVTSIVCIPNKSGALELFAVSGGSVVHTYQSNPGQAWAGWYSLGGGGITGDICAARNQDGRLEVFCIAGGSAWHKWQSHPDNAFVDDWDNLGGGGLTQICVGANQDGHLELFCRCSDTSAWHIWQTAPDRGWVGGWSALNGSDSSIACGRNQDGHLELFGIGTSSYNLFHCWETANNNSSSWNGWSGMGGNWLDLQ